MRQHHYTTTALALLCGLGLAATVTPAGAQETEDLGICDRNNDGWVDSQEADVCGQVQFDQLPGRPPYMTQQQFLLEFAETDDADGLFAEADADQDGQISRDEWLSWNEQRFAGATEASGGRMTMDDYERFARGQEALVVVAAEAGDIMAQLEGSGQFNTLVRAIEAAGLVEELKDAGPYTMFAPTDQAFNQLPQDKLDQLMQAQDKSRLENLLKHHIVSGEAYPADALPEQLKPMEGGTLNVAIGDSGGAVLRPQGGQQVAITREIPADNGYVHVVDSVLVPQQLTQMLQTGQQQAQQQSGQQQAAAQSRQQAQQSGQSGQQQSAQSAQQSQQQSSQSGQQQAAAQSGQQGQQSGGQQGQEQSGQSGQQQASAAGGQQQAGQQTVFGGGDVTSQDWTSVGADTFNQADADQSGFVTQQELERWAQTNWGGTPGGGDDDGPLFGLLDVNDDKQVAQDEWFTQESFGALDDDGSGVLEDDEFRV